MWDLIVSVPDHCLSFYFLYSIISVKKNEQGLLDLRYPRNKNEIIANGVETVGLIDTGSEINTVGEPFCESLHPKPGIHVVEELEIKCVDDSTLPYRGFIELTIGVPALK